MKTIVPKFTLGELLAPPAAPTPGASPCPHCGRPIRGRGWAQHLEACPAKAASKRRRAPRRRVRA